MAKTIRLWLGAFAVIAVVVAVAYVARTRSGTERWTDARRPVIPELSELARQGAQAFTVHCAACHAPDAGGTATGPALVHPVYRPSHHADVTFGLAVRRGVMAHHWRFGDMPPVPQVTAADVARMTQYIREVQRANGIE